jgi:hypothetical protein
MITAVARRFISRTTLKGVVALLVILASGLVPVGAAKAADLAFPILFVPVYSQNELIQGVFTDTRITVFNPSRHCPLAQDPGCTAGFFASLPANTELEMFWFDDEENLLTINSIRITPFDVEVVTGPTIPNGTGSAILVNLLQFPVLILAFFHPLTAVVEIGIKPAAGSILDGTPEAALLKAVTAVEAQFIPALAGEFPRIEVTAGPNGGALPFPDGYETVIVETCLLSGVLQNFVVDDNEVFLYDVLIPCTGINVEGPDLVVFTPDDGGLLSDFGVISPPPLGKLKQGYNRLGIDVNTIGGPFNFPPFFGATLFHGQAFVVLPGLTIDRQAYSYNMPANYFFPFTALQRPVQEGVALITDPMTQAINITLDQVILPALSSWLGVGPFCLELGQAGADLAEACASHSLTSQE